MQSQFDALARKEPGADEVEFWFARDLQEPLGYARWENFITAIQRAIESCKTTGYDPDHHFRGVTKMVPIGSGAGRSIDDFMPFLLYTSDAAAEPTRVCTCVCRPLSNQTTVSR